METAFFIQIANAILPAVIFLMQISGTVMVQFFSRAACSRYYVEGWLMPMHFMMAQRLAQAMLTLGLAILYAPILPISPLIGLVAMVIHYAADQFVVLRRSRQPPPFGADVEALAGANVIMRLLPLFQVGGLHEHAIARPEIHTCVTVCACLTVCSVHTINDAVAGKCRLMRLVMCC